MMDKDEKQPVKIKQKLSKKEPAAAKMGAFPGPQVPNMYPAAAVWQKRTILIVVSILSALILSPKLSTSVFKYNPGDIARQNIKVAEDALVEDTLSTQKKREKARGLSPDAYDLDETAAWEIKGRIENAFLGMRSDLDEIENRAGEYIAKEKLSLKERVNADEIVSAYLEESRGERFAAFQEVLGIPVKKVDFELVETMGFAGALEDKLKLVVVPIMSKGVVSSIEALSAAKETGIIIRNVKNQQERLETNFSSLYDLAEAREGAKEQILSSKKLFGKKSAAVFSLWASGLITANLTFNKNETEARKEKAAEEVSSVFFHLKEGEMILREGERITEEQVMILNALSEQNRPMVSYLRLLGLVFLVSFILFLVYHFSVENIRKVRLNLEDIVFTGILFVLTLLLARMTIPVTEALGRAFPHIPAVSYQYLVTAAAGAMLVRIVLNSEIAIIFSVVLSLMVAIIMKDSLIFGIYTFAGCITGAHMVRHCKNRSSLIKAGFYVGAVNIAIVLIFGLAYGELFSKEVLFNMLFALSGGVLSGIVVTGVIPIVEAIFGYTTNFKLLELASMDHPLMKELITQAPGTYHHSWILANLVENAAEAINANSLFAKVSALYHDIGKMKKPQYFYENQRGGKNPHDKLAPSLSSLIIIGHVKDGIELAREHKLGKRLTEIIPQHHGTNLISYFYSKAKDQEDPDVHSVDEKDFRYPGPKPQTKEAGLVMLADAVEAATRTIQDPTPARIKGAVKKIIGNIFEDGQLDECELTLKDINLIAESFNRILNGVFHARIDYPEPVVKGGDAKKNESTTGDKKSLEGDKKERGRKEGEGDT
ncbi:MAG: HDIG domain-containing protein [Proteobacteria bacterium]|nr:HDIG domain-containing protein [Pseudomonadota bacterium]